MRAPNQRGHIMSSTHDIDAGNGDELREQVAERYGSLARGVLGADEPGSCWGPEACVPDGNPITTDLYTDQESGVVPENALIASLGCGNPTALADLDEGQVVLDLGSGGGIDVLLSARRVGPGGKATGST